MNRKWDGRQKRLCSSKAKQIWLIWRGLVLAACGSEKGRNYTGREDHNQFEFKTDAFTKKTYTVSSGYMVFGYMVFSAIWSDFCWSH